MTIIQRRFVNTKRTGVLHLSILAVNIITSKYKIFRYKKTSHEKNEKREIE